MHCFVIHAIKSFGDKVEADKKKVILSWKEMEMHRILDLEAM